MDLALLPAPVLRCLALIGYWQAPPELRTRLDHWDEADEGNRLAAAADLDLLVSLLAR
jgi:hypothetical protein